MLSIFSCTCWPFMYLLWRNVYSGPLPIFSWIFCCLFYFILFAFEMCEFFLCFGYNPSLLMEAWTLLHCLLSSVSWLHASTNFSSYLPCPPTKLIISCFFSLHPSFSLADYPHRRQIWQITILIMIHIFIQVFIWNKYSKGPNLKRVGSCLKFRKTDSYQVTLFCLTYDLK